MSRYGGSIIGAVGRATNLDCDLSSHPSRWVCQDIRDFWVALSLTLCAAGSTKMVTQSRGARLSLNLFVGVKSKNIMPILL